MLARYSQHVSRTSNIYPATCVCQHICIRIHVARPGYMFPGDMCPGVHAALATLVTYVDDIRTFYNTAIVLAESYLGQLPTPCTYRTTNTCK